MTRFRIVAVGLVIAALAVVAFVMSGGVGTTSGTKATRLESWVTSTHLGQRVGTLEADGSALHKVLAARKGTSAVHTVCAAMANDAESANGVLPAPDVAVTRKLARAYGLEYDAAQVCYRAGASDHALLSRSEADRSHAVALIDDVLRTVHRITHRTVTVTTTPVAGATGTGTSFM